MTDPLPWGHPNGREPQKPKGVPLNINRKDLPDWEPPKQLDPTEALIEFAKVLGDAGLILTGLPEATGQIVRVPTRDDKRGKKSGWYVLYDGDFMGGSYGDFRTGNNGNAWSSVRSDAMTAAQVAEMHRQRQAAKAQREAKQRELWGEAAKEAAQAWQDGTTVASHPYLELKQVTPSKIRVSNSPDLYPDWLMVPAIDEQGEIATIQFISDDGTKYFLTGGRKMGCYHLVPGDMDLIYIAEGYATALTIAEATGNACAVAWDAGNLMAVAENVRAKYPNSSLVVAGDNDHENTKANVGHEKAQAVASALGLRAVFPDCGPGQSDFNDIGVERTREILEVKSRDESLPAPLPLFPELPPGEPYPIEALGPVMASAAEAIAMKVQVPTAVAAQSVLATASLAAQGLYEVETLGSYRPLSNFFLTILHSGGRKTASDHLANGPIREFERWERLRTKDADLEWENRVAVWKKRREAILKSKSDDKVGQLRELGAEPPRPMRPILVVTEPTGEALLRVLGTDRPSMGLFADEGGQFLGGHANRKESQVMTSTILSSLWDGSPIKRTRVHDGNVAYYGRRLSMHLMVQDGIDGLLLNNEQFRAQGLLSRFLCAAPPSLAGTRFYRETGSIKGVMTVYESACLELLKSDLPILSEDDWELQTRQIPLSRQAKDKVITFSNEIESRQGKDGDLAHMLDFASKLTEHAIRLAAVIHVIENNPAAALSAETMELGIQLARYYLSETIRLRSRNVSTDVMQAMNLLNWLRERWEEDFLYLAPIMKTGPNALRQRKALMTALRVLEQNHYLIPIKEPRKIDGRLRKEVWKCNFL